LFKFHARTATIAKSATSECILHICGRDWNSSGQALKNGD
jgi:hypothetical protein